ncbi:ABC transporter permease subunit [Nocardioides jiangxiensis]|uniref:ABC transporter permease n=1 Tax=Nocardioides jiangxiensis TaxID=3064524 RepID=A0ABT9B0H6_9ACTN|nr:ABC transporter permease subunit [Nocardioides sp. WY-20]MDO7867748.1 ABC transporter permease [Nocardioides sp. WY-20]
MTAALRYEWTRLRTLRSTWWLTFGVLAVGVGFTAIAALVVRVNVHADQINGSTLDGDMARFYVEAAMTQFSVVDPMFYLVAFVAAIVGILGWGHEYRHGMIRATLTAVPKRWAVFTAKYAVVALWVSVLVVTSCLLSLLVAGVFFTGLDVQYDAGDILSTVVRHVVYSVLVTWVAMSLTVLVRHQTFALVMLFLWPMGIETLFKAFGVMVSAFTGNKDYVHVMRFLPFNAGGRIMQTFGALPDGTFGRQQDLSVFGDPLSLVGGLVVFGGFAALLTAAAFAAFTTRDA